MSYFRERCIGLVLFLIVVSSAFAQPADSSGLRVLERGAIRLSLSVPGDEQNYRGTRFDHSGMFHKIQVGKHQLCERWRIGPANPDANDDVTGPCEEFGNAAPLGYVPNRAGSNFVKIGVGILKQPEESKYRFSNPYEFVQRGVWTTHQDNSSITFQQSLTDDPVSKAIGYEYKKTVRITDSGFRIEHRIKNTGRNSWSTDHYNHNFFLVDSDKVGPNYELHLPYAIKPINRMAGFDETIDTVGQTIRFRELVGTRSFFAELSGHANKTSDHQFRLKHLPTGITIECKGTSPLSKMNFWGMANTICPEPYIQINLESNAELEWALEYVLTVGAD